MPNDFALNVNAGCYFCQDNLPVAQLENAALRNIQDLLVFLGGIFAGEGYMFDSVNELAVLGFLARMAENAREHWEDVGETPGGNLQQAEKD